MKKIGLFIILSRIVLISIEKIKYFLLWAAVSIGLLYFWIFADTLVYLEIPQRRIYFYLIGLLLIYVIAKITLRAVEYFNDEKLIVEIQDNIPELKDELLSSWQLHNKPQIGTSDELVEELISKTEQKIKKQSPFKLIRFKDELLKPVLYSCGLIILSLLIYFIAPQKTEVEIQRMMNALKKQQWEKWFTVEPGNKKIALGEEINIKVTPIKALYKEPVLYMRENEGGWRTPESFVKESGEYIYEIQELVDKIEYYVKWSDYKTPVFYLEPETVPIFGNFEITYKYPDYTQIPAETVKGNPNISCIYGTKAEVKAESNKPIKKAYVLLNDKKDKPVKITRSKIRFDLNIEKSGKYKIIAKGVDGTFDQNPPEYVINVKSDKNPVIELISPEDDLVISEKIGIPIIYEAYDDFGISKINLVYWVNERSKQTVVLNDILAGSQNYTLEYEWNISNINVDAGDKINYYLEIFDNDTNFGPKSEKTDVQMLKIFDYTTQHKEIEKELEEFREDLLNILADQTMAKDTVEKLENKFSTSTYNNALNQQKKVAKDISKPIKDLDDLLRKMESDPYTDYSTYNEYKGMRDHLDHLKNNSMRKAERSLENKKISNAKNEQEKIIASLEKITLLAEDIWQYQKMRDLFDKTIDLESAGDKFEQALNDNASPEELKELMNDISNMLNDIHKQLSDLPKELPEDFINSPAVKKIDMQETKDLASELNKAIEQGDYERAKQLAKKLKEQLKSMLETIQKAGENVGFTQNASQQMQESINRNALELESIIVSQENLLEETKKYEEKRKKELFKRQEILLAELAKRQKELINKTQVLQKETRKKLNMYPSFAVKSLPLMNKVLKEFEEKRAFNSQKYLKDIIGHLKTGENIAQSKKNLNNAKKADEVIKDIQSIKKGEEEILDLLKNKKMDEIFSSKEQKDIKKLGERQERLKERTKKLRNELQTFGRKSSVIDPETLENMQGAENEMNDASQNLENNDTLNAIESEKNALEYLKSGKEGLSQAEQKMQGQGEMSGQKIGNPIQQYRHGTTGIRNEPVKLPDIDDYKAPREFRQEIIDALKEKYPKEYEKIIKEYYRKLTE